MYLKHWIIPIDFMFIRFLLWFSNKYVYLFNDMATQAVWSSVNAEEHDAELLK